MSGIKKSDRFIPVVTVVLYFGNEPWDGPLGIHDINLSKEDILNRLIERLSITQVSAQHYYDQFAEKALA